MGDDGASGCSGGGVLDLSRSEEIESGWSECSRSVILYIVSDPGLNATNWLKSKGSVIIGRICLEWRSPLAFDVLKQTLSKDMEELGKTNLVHVGRRLESIIYEAPS